MVRPIVGIGDLIILTATFSGLRRVAHRGPLTFAFPLGGLLLALVVGLIAGKAPALPFLAAATLLFAALHRRRNAVTGYSFSPKESRE